MRTIPTFVDGNFHGFDTYKEIIRLLTESRELAASKQEDEQADHMIYGYFDWDDDGNVVTARLYSGIAKTEAEFESIAILPKAHIYAIHKRP